MGRCRRKKPVYYTAFGAGLLVGALLPYKALVVLLGIALLFCGLTCGKR